MKVNLFSLVIVIFIFSCSSENDNNFELVEGDWQVDEFYHKNQDLSSNDHYLMGFEKSDQFWIRKIDYTNDFNQASFKLFEESDSLKITINNSEDKRLIGDYNLYIDTIRESKTHYYINITLDGQHTYISGRKGRSK
ncbi:hypothetical protein BC962_3231 [Gillisia mitskevichiae]|uniref:Lipocalin-like protein n=2 Tax=Gillisia mitskevichiae TaxID=270921 RepID=A0A495NVY1_9FLAO|nr:hypothetical protein BC962_3231 [Gillisia mitskevichiae]